MKKWFLNLKTSVKLLSTFIFIAAIMAGVSAFAIINMNKINTIGSDMYTQALVPMENMALAKNDLLQLKAAWRDIALTESTADTHVKMEEVKLLRDNIEENISIYVDSYVNEDEAAKQEAQEFFNTFMSDFDTYNTAYDTSVQSVTSDRTKFQQLDEELDGLHNRLTGHLDEIWEVDMAISEEEHQRSQDLFFTTTVIMVIIVTLTIAICIMLGMMLTRAVARPLRNISTVMEKVADGDLTVSADIDTKDEVGLLAQSVNTMVSKLRQTVQNILSAAENLSASSEQVSASMEEITSASTNQANAAQTMNELFGELSEAIRSVAQNTEEAAELANQTVQIAETGEKVVLSSVDGANAVSEQIANLEKDSNKIGEIIEVIDDIADQTNLLALNAAIEAARAGDQGRGFAVVADEVRKLAERSSEATKQITGIIEEMQKNTTLSVKSVAEGRAFTEQSGVAFENIIKMVNDTGNKVTEIAGASEQQASQSEEVLSFIENISAATEEAMASTEETATAAQSLADLAEELNQSVAVFRVNK
ncbi:methyl-accepting chemotaxis protein [Siminovitchia sediminis]|uniref:Methyl-accepting chemotaxis protein n=1 Tax=Siminovitchia sediminis TaxID=1274353 RepID=A0ABW4KBV1_9BACI